MFIGENDRSKTEAQEEVRAKSSKFCVKQQKTSRMTTKERLSFFFELFKETFSKRNSKH